MSQEVVNAILPIVVAILFAFLAGGLTIGGGIVLALNQILKSKVVIEFLHHLAASASPELIQILRESGQLLDEVAAPDAPATTPAA